MTSKIEELPASSCNFCGKGKGDVYKIVVANSVGICDECVALCNKVLTDEKSKSGLKQLKPKKLAFQAACNKNLTHGGVKMRSWTWRIHFGG